MSVLGAIHSAAVPALPRLALSDSLGRRLPAQIAALIRQASGQSNSRRCRSDRGAPVCARASVQQYSSSPTARPQPLGDRSLQTTPATSCLVIRGLRGTPLRSPPRRVIARFPADFTNVCERAYPPPCPPLVLSPAAMGLSGAPLKPALRYAVLQVPEHDTPFGSPRAILRPMPGRRNSVGRRAAALIETQESHARSSPRTSLRCCLSPEAKAIQDESGAADLGRQSRKRGISWGTGPS